MAYYNANPFANVARGTDLVPTYCKINVYDREGMLIRSYYNSDLNEVVKKLTSEAFMYKQRFKVVTDQDHVQYIP